MYPKYFLSALLLLVAYSCIGQNMTVKELHKIIRKKTNIREHNDDIWNVEYKDFPVMIVADNKANRMRILSPIVPRNAVNERLLEKLLEANFHSALDAKYCIWEGVIISIFTHPLKELNKERIVDAIQQVVRLSETFGTTFSSTDLNFDEHINASERRINVKPQRTDKD